jgi:hypothetical protein
LSNLSSFKIFKIKLIISSFGWQILSEFSFIIFRWSISLSNAEKSEFQLFISSLREAQWIKERR